MKLIRGCARKGYRRGGEELELRVYLYLGFEFSEVYRFDLLNSLNTEA